MEILKEDQIANEISTSEYQPVMASLRLRSERSQIQIPILPWKLGG